MRETVTISLPQAVRRELDRVAKEEGVSRNDVVVSSRPLLDELRDVLTRKLRQRAADVRATVRLFEETFTVVTPVPLEAPACRDADDDVVLATARAGECAVIVSGDQDLLILDPFQGIRILAPSAFWKWE